ncbi:MAG: hypothetical protein WBJ87_08680 [Candidatus Hydrothermia bacterium]
MANRVTASDVKDIMDNCTVDDTIIESLITSANALINKVFEDDVDITETILTEIERYLTAHFIASGIQRSTSVERIGDAEVRYTGTYGDLLRSTPYGQTVLILDFTGKISKLGRSKISMYAIPQFDDE